MKCINKNPDTFCNVSNVYSENIFEAIIALGVMLTVLVLTWNRLYYGVDFTDESFYISLAYRFSLGDIPIGDEQNLAQFASFLFMPLIRLFLYLQGGTDGIVIFSRYLHFIFTMLVGLSVFLAVRRALYWPLALMIATICIVFVPFNIHGLSYNTMGSGFLTIGCFLGVIYQDNDLRPKWPYFLSGFSHCLAILVYPPLFIAICVYAALILIDRNYLKMSQMNYVCGGLLAAIIPLTLILQAGVAALQPLIGYVTSVTPQERGWKKISDVIFNFWMQTPFVSALFASMMALVIWHLFKPRWMRFILPFLPFLLFVYTITANGTTSLYFVIAISLLGPFVYLIVGQDNFAKRLYKLIWLPSFIGGLITAWSSSNGAINAVIGMFPAMLVSTIFMVRAFQLMKISTKITRIIQCTMMIIIPILIILPLLVGEYLDIYGEAVPYTSSLTERVIDGPYRNIKTTTAKNVFINNLSRDIASFSRPSDTTLFFYDFPAGYLFGNLRPVTNSVWLPAPVESTFIDRTPTIEYYERKHIKPSLVFQLKKPTMLNDKIVNMIRGKEYQEIFDCDSYSIFRLQSKTKNL